MTNPYIKSIAFSSASLEQVFNDHASSLWCANGRLSGFSPNPVPSIAAYPGFTDLGSGNVQVSVILSTVPSERSDTASTQYSLCMANGIVLKVEGDVSFSQVLTGAIGSLASQDLVIYVEFDENPESDPVFDISIESLIDAAPEGKAKLAKFDSASLSWIAMPSVSVGSVFKSAIEAITSRGGFVASQSSDRSLSVGPGVVITSFGRIVNTSIRPVNLDFFTNPDSLTYIYPLTPASGTVYRHDSLYVVDQGDETLPPKFQIVYGKDVKTTVDAVANVVPSKDPDLVPLASFIVSVTSTAVRKIQKVIDARPVLNWQTDSVASSAPVIVAPIEVFTDRQGGIAFTITDSDSNNTEWEVGVYSSSDPAQLKVQRLVFGRRQPVITQLFSSPATPGLREFTPTTAQFVPKPYLNKSSVKIITLVNGLSTDILRDDRFDVKLDFFYGNFYEIDSSNKGIKILDASVPDFTSSQTFSVEYKQVLPFAAYGSDGTRYDQLAADFANHISASNAAAHTSSNILYDNSDQVVDFLPDSVSSQEFLNVVARKAFGVLGETALQTKFVIPIKLTGTVIAWDRTGFPTIPLYKQYDRPDLEILITQVGGRAAKFVSLKSGTVQGITFAFTAYGTGGASSSYGVALGPGDPASGEIISGSGTLSIYKSSSPSTPTAISVNFYQTRAASSLVGGRIVYGAFGTATTGATDLNIPVLIGEEVWAILDFPSLSSTDAAGRTFIDGQLLISMAS